MLGIFEYLKISVSDLIETLGLVMTRPGRMASAVYTGGNSLENALLYYFFLFSASALIVLLPFNLGAEFRTYAQAMMVTGFLILAVTSVAFFCALRLAGIPIPFLKALTIKTFVAGAYILAVSVATALATSLIMSLSPEEKDTFVALTLGCIPMFDFGGPKPAITAPIFGFSIYVGLSLAALAFNLFLFAGVFAGLAPYSGRARATYVSIVIVFVFLDYTLAAAFAGRNLNTGTAFCTEYRESGSFGA